MPQQQKPKVLLIGWDAADWKIITPLMDAGKMPNLNKMVNEGVMGNLATLHPAISPMLWTSIATGKRPFKHGIHGFTEPNPHGGGIRPVSSYSRSTRALWNMLHLHGMRSNVVGWWPSHPAEPINGVMVSNHFSRANTPLDQPWPLPQGVVHPNRLTEHLAKLRLHPQELTAEIIGLFVPAFHKIDQEKDHRLESLAKIIADAASIQAAATALMQLEPWDFMGVYFDAIDHFCHAFMNYHPPRMEWVDAVDFELFKGVVEGGYRYHDLMLGVLLELAGEESTVILISDHGFHPDHLRPRHIPVEPAGPAAQHRQQGILVMKGPGIKKDEIIHGASLLDITPTILHLYGLPVGEDMDGTPLVNALREPAPIATIPSWDDLPGEDGSHPEELQIDPVANREAIAQLVALGYIDKPADDLEEALEETVRELDYNLARAHMDANRHLDALPLLEKLTTQWPDESRFGIHLLQALQGLGRIPQAREAMKRLFITRETSAVRAREELKRWEEEHKDSKPEDLTDEERYELRRLGSLTGTNPQAVEFLLAGQCLAEGDASAALLHLGKAEEFNPEGVELQIRKGEALLHLKQWRQAQACFTRALEIDGENAAPHLGLCRCNLGLLRNKLALACALDAIALSYLNPAAHFYLGVALHRLRRPLQAVEALKVALMQNPNMVQALIRIAFIIEKRLKDPVLAGQYRQKAEEARRRVREITSGALSPRVAQAKRTAITSERYALEQDPELPQKITSPLTETITIVSGLPRSGTSMMMQILEAGGITPLVDHHRPADADNEKGYFEDARARGLRRDASWLPEARGKGVKIVAQLLANLPADPANSYGVIFMLRDLNEVVASQRDMLAAQGKEGARIPDTLLKHTYITQIQQIRKLLASRRIPVLYVEHGDTIRDPSAASARINVFLGGSLDEAAMAGAVVPHLHRHTRTK